MDHKEVKNKVTKILSEKLDIDIANDIKLDDSLANVGISSVTFIKLLVEIETEFEIEFETKFLDINKFTSINKIISYIEDLLSR